MNPPPRGFALPAALFALVIVGLMVTGGFYAAQHDTRMGVVDREARAAFYVAEAGAVQVAEDWDMSVYGALEPWESTTVRGMVEGGEYRVDVMRTSEVSFLLESTGTRTGYGAAPGVASHTIGLAIRLRRARIDPGAALSTRGGLSLGEGSRISGRDQIPTGWTEVCEAGTESHRAGIVTDDEQALVIRGRAVEVRGEPPLAENPDASLAHLLNFGEMEWDDLTRLARPSHVHRQRTLTGVGPRLSPDGTCAVDEARNWGAPLDPASPCFDFHPIIHAQADLRLSGGSGQGILLVDGDLTVEGGFHFHGPVFVRGTLTTLGSGGHFTGGVVAANVDLGTSRIQSQSVVEYSSCAIARAVAANPGLARATLLGERSWVDLSN